MFKVIAFTSPEIQGSIGEADFFSNLLSSGAIDYLHLRKPTADKKQIEEVLASYPERLLPAMTLHSYFELTETYPVGGLHLNSGNPVIKKNILENSVLKLRVSGSIHSVGELNKIIERKKKSSGICYKYITLSPVFDSISKSGYKSAFDLDDGLLSLSLEEAKKNGIDVIALGGIRPEDFSRLSEAGFKGAALLGYLVESERKKRIEIEKEIKYFKTYVTVHNKH